MLFLLFVLNVNGSFVVLLLVFSDAFLLVHCPGGSSGGWRPIQAVTVFGSFANTNVVFRFDSIDPISGASGNDRR